MVQEAEKFKDEDNAMKDKIEAKNEYENLLFQTKSTIDNVEDKLSEDEKNILNDKITEERTWLESEDHTIDEYKSKKDEFNVFVQPYMTKLYPQGPGPDEMQVPEGMSETTPQEDIGPSIDEVD